MTLARLSKKTDFKLYDHIFFGTVPRVVTYATTKRRPTNRTYARLVFLSIALLLGCNRKFQPGSTAPEIPPAKSPEYSFRGYFIDGRMPFSDVFSKLRQKNFRAVIFSIDETMDPSDRKANIDNAITEAHQNELLLIASVEVLKIQGNAAVMMNPARPDHKRALKEKIADLVRAFNFDGLHILIRPDQVSGFINDPESQQIFQSDSLQVPMNFAEWARYRITDLVEDAVAEAMLVKPYLPVCISLGDLETGKSDEYDNMVLGWLEKGIADFIIPFFHFEDAATETVNWQNLKNRTPLHRYIYPLLEFSGESAGAPLQARIENLAREEAEGFVIYLPEGGGLDPVIVPSFPADPAWDNYAANYKRADPRQYVGLNLRHFLEPGLEDRLIVTGNGTSVKKPDSLGRIGLVCPQVPDTISLQINQQFIHLPVADWALPFKYEVLPDMKTRRELPWLEFRRTPGRIGSDSIFHFLFKTAYPARRPPEFQPG
ncbi:MAG TPA: family 10 glycosylhydrolase [Cyclobacteriaceae bacterium]|nr:family 10 glycosylhydrolase [Cyclobacteriaceae bacterium]